MRCFFAGALFLAIVTIEAGATVIEVEVPVHREWCNTVTVPDARQLRTPGDQQGLFRSAFEPIAQCARFKGVSDIGVPFVRETIKGKANPDRLELVFCAAISKETPACSGISVRIIPKVNMLAAVCREEESAKCQGEIETVLKDVPWKLDEAAIRSLPWRFVRANSSTASSATIIAALNGSSLRIGVGEDTRKEELLPFVVVAAPVPVTPAAEGAKR